MGNVAFILITIFCVIIMIPCVGIGWTGWQMINKLGRFPSKTPAIQMSVLFQLIFIEVISLTLLIAFFKILVSE